MKKNTKKTATVVGMFGLLGLVLGMGGSTFAKYQTAVSLPAQQATVAKWGVVAQITGVTSGVNEEAKMFNTSYNGGAIKSSATHAVIAPGASGKLSLEISGNPEVKVSINVAFTLTDIHDGDYYPIEWKVGKETFNGADAVTSIQAKFNAGATIEANAGTLARTITLEWEWPFEKGATPEEIKANNDKDVALAEAGATLSYSLTATINQVQ